MNIKENLTALKVPLGTSKGSSRTAKAFVVSSSRDPGPECWDWGGAGEAASHSKGALLGLWDCHCPLSGVTHSPGSSTGSPAPAVSLLLTGPPSHGCPHACSAAGCPFTLPTPAPENRNLTGHSRANLSLRGCRPALKLMPHLQPRCLGKLLLVPYPQTQSL